MKRLLRLSEQPLLIGRRDSRCAVPNAELPYTYTRCVFTVASLMNNARAISRFPLALATRPSTSRSRGLNGSPADVRTRDISVAASDGDSTA